jgi:hypothetical protein
MDNILNKFIKTFIVVELVVIIISIIISLLSFTSPDYYFMFLYFVLLKLFIYFFYIEIIIELTIGIIIFIICLIRKKIKYIFTKKVLWFFPIILFLIYSIYLIFENDLRNKSIIFLIINNIGIILWLNILIFNNMNIKNKYIIFYSLHIPIKYILIYFLNIFL